MVLAFQLDWPRNDVIRLSTPAYFDKRRFIKGFMPFSHFFQIVCYNSKNSSFYAAVAAVISAEVIKNAMWGDVKPGTFIYIWFTIETL